MYRQIDGVAMGSPLVPRWQIYLLAIMNQTFSMKFQNLPYTVVTLMTPFPFFTKKLNSKNFEIVLTRFTPPKNLPMKLKYYIHLCNSCEILAKPPEES